jgi:ectoine hydroxylase-related dioxygenase (phytanoyl-CoA dioxygenase family)
VLAAPEVRALSMMPALLRIAQTYIGPAAFPFRATLFDKSLESNWLVPWHQDTGLPVKARSSQVGWGPWTHKGGVLHAIAPAAALETVVALRVHLDDSTIANGPLRVLPGTHSGGVLAHAEIESLARTMTPVDCVIDSGGVIAMRPLLVHNSSKSRDDRPRRVLHIEYAVTALFAGEIELAVG